MAKRYHESAAMITEDPNAMSFMPERTVFKKYAANEYNMREEYDDTIVGIDQQKDGDGAMIRRATKPRKA